MRVSVRAATTLLAALAAALSIVGAVYAIESRQPGPDALGRHLPPAVVRQFDLDIEGNIPTWFGSVLLLVSAALCAMVAASGTRRDAHPWRVIGLVLVAMSVDEIATIHEIVGRYIAAAGVLERFDVYTWLLPGSLVALGLVLLGRRAARGLTPAARRGVLVAGALFFGGAVGVEAIGAVLFERYYGTATFSALVWVEESLEMAGAVTLIHTLMVELRDRGEAAGLRFSV